MIALAADGLVLVELSNATKDYCYEVVANGQLPYRIESLLCKHSPLLTVEQKALTFIAPPQHQLSYYTLSVHSIYTVLPNPEQRVICEGEIVEAKRAHYSSLGVRIGELVE